MYNLLERWQQWNVDINERPLQGRDLVKLVLCRDTCLASLKDLQFYHCSRFVRYSTNARRVVKVSFVSSEHFTHGQGSFYLFRGKKLVYLIVKVLSTLDVWIVSTVSSHCLNTMMNFPT